MKQFTHKLGVWGAILGLFLALPVGAQQDSQVGGVLSLVNEELVKLEDLGIENPGLLQTNPFYFMKNLRRSTQRAFKFGPMQRAELELGILNEKAAELTRLEEVIPDNGEALIRALGLYQNNLDDLNYLLRNTNPKEVVGAADQFLNKLIDLGLKHIRLFDQLKLNEDVRMKTRLDALQSDLSNTIVFALQTFDTPIKSGERLRGVLSTQRGGVFKELRLAEVADRFEEKASYQAPLKGVLLGLKEDLLLEGEVKLVVRNMFSVLPAALERLVGEHARRVRVLDEAREYGLNVELKNDLGSIRQLILDVSGSARVISKPDSEKMLADAQLATDFVKQLAKESGERSQAVSDLIAKAEFNLKQARESMDANQYVAAFGQASIAAAAAKNAIVQLNRKANIDAEIRNLKAIYDDMQNRAAQSGFTADNAPQLFALFAGAEQNLAQLSDMEIKEKKLDVIIPAMRSARLLLIEARMSLEDLLAQRTEEAKALRAAQPLIQRVLQ
jgi:hypothetical protein